MIIRRKILNEECYQLLGFAESKLRQLEDRRSLAGVSLLTQTLAFDGFFILLKTYGEVGDILMWFIGGEGQILFSSPDSTTTIYIYDFINDKIKKLTTIDDREEGELHPFANKVSHAAENVSITNAGKQAALDPSLIDYAIQYEYEAEVLLSETAVSIRVADAIAAVKTLPDMNDWEWLSEYSSCMGNLVFLAGKKTTERWNLWSGITLWSFNVASRALSAAYVWIPSFWYSDPGGIGRVFPVGWYYGYYADTASIMAKVEAYLSYYTAGVQAGQIAGIQGGAPTIGSGGVYDLVGQITSDCKVRFACFLDNKFRNVHLNYGHAELLYRANGIDYGYLCVYLQNEPMQYYGSPSALYQSDDMRTIYTPLVGLNTLSAVFDILPFFETIEPESLKVSMWTLPSWDDPDSIYGTSYAAICIVISQGTKAIVYRWKGYGGEVYRTEKYHSHSSGYDGQILAVFEATANEIDKVLVWDLFGTRGDGAVEREVYGKTVKYSGGGSTLLRESEKPADKAALSACVIPYRGDGFEPKELTYDLASQTPEETAPEDTWTGLAFLGVMGYNIFLTGSMTLQKLACSDGVTAELIFDDGPCFGNRSILTEAIASASIAGGEETPVNWTVQPEDGELVSYTGPFSGASDALTQIIHTMSGSSVPTVYVPFEIMFGVWTRTDTGLQIVPAGVSGTGVGFYGLSDTFTISYDALEGKAIANNATGDVTFGGCASADGTWLDTPDCLVPCNGYAEVTGSSTCGQDGGGGRSIPYVTPSISGSDTISAVPEPYVVSGGQAPHTWACTGCTVDQSGNVTAVSACSEFTLTTTDGCGTEATKIVGWNTTPLEIVYSESCTGDATVCIGTVFSASGGSVPYTWTFSKGSFTEDDEDATSITITSVTCGTTGSSGAGTVSVEDACGNTAEVSVLVYGGAWGSSVTSDGTEAFTGFDCTTLVGCSSPSTPNTKTYNCIIGGRWYTEIVQACIMNCTQIAADPKRFSYKCHTGGTCFTCGPIFTSYNYTTPNPCGCGGFGTTAATRSFPLNWRIKSRSYKDWVCP